MAVAPNSQALSVGAILLAGGRGSRLQGTGGSRLHGTGGSRPEGTGGSRPEGTGGSRPEGTGGSRPEDTVKPLLEVGGTTLVRAAVDAATDAAARPITVVGPLLDPTLQVEWVREDPPYGGPVAGTVAALEAWTASARPDPEWTLLLACDLPEVRAAVRHLVADLPLLPADTEGLCLGDGSSRPQWLIGLYRTRALRSAASAVPDGGRDAPVRALLADLAIAVVSVPDDLTRDVDTWEDLEQARARVRRPS